MQRTTLETRDLKESIKFIETYLKNNPAKMSIIRIGSAGGYRRILLINELLHIKSKETSLEIVDELQTTPPSSQEAKNGIKQGAKEGTKMANGKNATAAMEIAFRFGECINSTPDAKISEGELKEIQNLSRQYSKDNLTISRDLAEKVAMGLLSIEEAIEIKKSTRNKE